MAEVILEQIGGALAVCDHEGRITAGTPSGRSLLSRMGVKLDTMPAPIVPDLWRLISAQDVGAAVQWRSSGDRHLLLGCTRYRLGSDGWLLIMSEISQKQSALAQTLHQQRLEAVGRLLATTTHDLRAPLASIVFNSDVLHTRLAELAPDRVREMIGDVKTAAERLRGTIDCLLDYVRLGPPVPAAASLKEILGRMQSLLRPLLRAGGHRLVAHLHDLAERAVGNPLAVEQIFVNLVVNSIEAAREPVTVRVSSTLEGRMLRVLVEDDGPGIPSECRLQVFDPFFTTKPDGTGIGLTSAREAARAAGGDVELVRWQKGAAFAVLLPAQIGETFGEVDR